MYIEAKSTATKKVKSSTSKSTPLRRQRRAEYFARSKPRGNWVGQRSADFTASPNRHVRRGMAAQHRKQLKQYRSGRWVITLGKAIQKFLKSP